MYLKWNTTSLSFVYMVHYKCMSDFTEKLKKNILYWFLIFSVLTCHNLLIKVLAASNWTKSSFPQTDEWIMEYCWSINKNIIMKFTDKWIELETIILSKNNSDPETWNIVDITFIFLGVLLHLQYLPISEHGKRHWTYLR